MNADLRSLLATLQKQRSETAYCTSEDKEIICRKIDSVITFADGQRAIWNALQELKPVRVRFLPRAGAANTSEFKQEFLYGAYSVRYRRRSGTRIGVVRRTAQTRLASLCRAIPACVAGPSRPDKPIPSDIAHCSSGC